MNAAGQRRLTPILVGTAVVLAALLGALLLGAGRGVEWDAPGTPEPLPAVRPMPLPPTSPLARFAEVWGRPLFMTDRKPAAVADAGDASGNIGDLELTGIIVTPGLRMALLRDRSKDATVRVKEGASLADSHWVLASLSARSAFFENGGERRELTLKVAAPDAPTKGQQPGMPPAQPSAAPPRMPPGGMTIQRQGGTGMTGPALPNPAAAATRQAPPRQDDDALQRARIEALKEAVQKRRMEQQQRQQQALDSQ